MKIQFGTYELEFEDRITQLFEKHVYDTIADSALTYVSARTGIENAEENCKKYSKEEIFNFIMESVIEDLRLCGVSVNG